MPRTKKSPIAPKRGRGGRGGPGGPGVGRGNGGARQPAPGFRSSAFGFTLLDEARQTSQHDQSFWTTKLRSQPVTFVSAGAIEPMKQLNRLLQKGDPDDFPKKSTGIEEKEEREEEKERQDDLKPAFLEVALERASRPEPPLEKESTFFFDLDGDASYSRQARSLVNVPTRPSISESSSDEEVILFKGRNLSDRSAAQSTNISLAQLQTEIQVVEEEIQPPLQETTRLAGSSQVRNAKVFTRHRGKVGHRSKDAADAEEALIADYIANMQQSGEYDSLIHAHPYQHRDLGDSDGNIFVDEDPSEASTPPTVPLTGDQKSGDERGKEISERQPGQGGRRRTDALPEERYASESELDDETLARLISGGEAEGECNLNFPEESSDISSEEDDNDGEIAREAFDADDLMDWNRPSLLTNRGKKKSKASKGLMEFDVSDAELEQALQAAWKGDRMKKSQRKKQREELRALGLLGKNVDPDEPMVKYSTGMSLDQVAEELKAFLQTKTDTLTLPPMDRHARKVIHELANKFNVKSKSTGKGEQRRPTLYRTARTLPFVEPTFDRAVSRINRPYFPRMDGRSKQSAKTGKTQSSYAQASYRDGEIVGAAAPELGADNRGRSMLEKMGWSQGTALGSMNNKGILQPVVHTMKRTKAGLG